MRKFRQIRRPLALFLSLTLSLVLAAWTFVRYAIPMLSDKTIPCSYGQAVAFGCGSHFGMFTMLWLLIVLFTICVL